MPKRRGIQKVEGSAEEFEFTEAQQKARMTLISDAVHSALGGGSRSGKTFLLIRQIIVRAMKAAESRHVVFRFRFNALKASVILDTLPKVLKLCFPDALPPLSEMMNKTDWYMTLPNGSEIWFGGLDDKDRTEKILGMEFATIYFNECSQIPWASVVMAMSRLAQKTGLALKAFYDFNPPSKMHWTYQQFIKKINPSDKIPYADDHEHSFYLINPYDNKENLAPEYLKLLEGMPEAARNRFLLGQFADDSDGALWTVETMAQNRIMDSSKVPNMLRIVVAVDPSGCSGPEDYRSDEIGIVVCGLGTDGKGYVLEDLSGRYRPEEWGAIAANAFLRHSADSVVGEKNYGGDMVRAVIQAQNENIPYKEVTATRGKVVRAMPISSLYDQKKIHHVGVFKELEDQMYGTLASGYIGEKSPDRMDTLVWGMTELFPGITAPEEQRNWQPNPVIVAPRGSTRHDRSVRTSRVQRRL